MLSFFLYNFFLFTSDHCSISPTSFFLSPTQFECRFVFLCNCYAKLNEIFFFLFTHENCDNPRQWARSDCVLDFIIIFIQDCTLPAQPRLQLHCDSNRTRGPFLLLLLAGIDVVVVVATILGGENVGNNLISSRCVVIMHIIRADERGREEGRDIRLQHILSSSRR